MSSKPKPNSAENADNGGEKNIQPNKIVTGSFSNSRKNSVPPPPQLVAERVSMASIVDEDSEPEQYMTSEEHQKMLREQDRYLPIANISRIMKRFIPESGKIAKDAKECIQECVSEFVSFITSEASERCHNEKRKTINGEDILWAMQTLGFESYVEPLKIYLSKYRAACKGDKALQEMGLAPDDQDLANLDSMPSVAAHDLSALLAGGNHIVLNSENLGIVSEGGSNDRIVGQQVGQNLAGSSHHQSTNQQLAFITTSNGGNQQIMYLEPAHFQTNQSGGGQTQFITLNRAPPGVQIVQLVPAGSIANANGQQIITVQTGQQQNE